MVVICWYIDIVLIGDRVGSIVLGKKLGNKLFQVSIESFVNLLADIPCVSWIIC
jgi:hypothetical protein